jgi:hypothetical protein
LGRNITVKRKSKPVSAARVHPIEHDDNAYNSWLPVLETVARKRIQESEQTLFTTNAVGLWETFLQTVNPRVRQWHNCSECRHFIQRYGGLVRVLDDGRLESIFWTDSPPAPAEIRDAVELLCAVVESAEITGVFYPKVTEWGSHRTGDWRHMAIHCAADFVGDKVKTAHQRMAEKLEDHKTVLVALDEFPREFVQLAVDALNADTLYRGEKSLGGAQFLLDLHNIRQTVKGARNRSNLLWRAIARAPAGFCHPRSSMVGTLLEDLQAGLPWPDAAKKFAAKMHPLLYQRPQAPPKEGTIDQAEKLVEQMGLEPALHRRYARLEEVQTLWRDVPGAPPGQGSTETGVFDHLRESPRRGYRGSLGEIPPRTMTWVKFAAEVLPNAAELDLNVPIRGNFCAYLTATNPEAPPVLQWDRPERRNPVSWYVYHGGSPAMQWRLSAGPTRVTAIAAQPNEWYGGFEHFGKSVLFILEGCVDTHMNELCLFPECLKSELHGIRSVIEEHSKSRQRTGREEGSACGLRFGPRENQAVTLRVNTRTSTGLVTLDRWD